MALAVFGREIDAAIDGVARVVRHVRAPLSDICPPCAGSTPKITCINSVRPDPTSPAKPMISPFCAMKLTPAGAPGTRTFCTDKTGGSAVESSPVDPEIAC